MEAQIKKSQAMSETLGVPGRVLAGARGRVMVIDSSPGRSGVEPDALTSGEVFLAGLIGCGSVIIEATARERGIAMARARLVAVSMRHADDMARYSAIHITVEVTGTTQAEAEGLVRAYQSQCPIYALVSAATEVRVEVTAVPALAAG